MKAKKPQKTAKKREKTAKKHRCVAPFRRTSCTPERPRGGDDSREEVGNIPTSSLGFY